MTLKELISEHLASLYISMTAKNFAQMCKH